MPGRRENALSKINDRPHLVPEARSPQAQKRPTVHDEAGPEREKFVTAIATAQGYEPRYIRLDPHDNVAIVVNDLGLPAKTRFPCSLTEAATRFALSHPAMGTILVGIATPQQFDDALAAVQKGTLPQAALDPLSALRQAFSDEPR